MNLLQIDKNYSVLPWLIIMFVAILYLFILMPQGLGVSPDSVKYIESAESLASGHGYRVDNKLVTHWPPAYSFTLSLFYQLFRAKDILQAGIFLHIAWIIILGFTFQKILEELSFGKPLNHALLFAFLTATPLTVVLYLWTELQYITLLTASFLYFLRWRKYNKFRYLLIAGFLGLCSLLTRYAGIGFIGGYLLVLLLANQGLFKKLKSMSLYILPIVLGLSVWLSYVKSHSVSATNREMVIHLIPLFKLLKSFKTIITWFIGHWMAIIPFLGFFVLLIRFIQTGIDDLKKYLKKHRIIIVDLLLLMLSYYLFLIVSMSFFDDHTPMDNRILSPLFPFLLLVVGYFLHFIMVQKAWKYGSIMPYLMSASVLLSSMNIWFDHYENGSGYTHKKYTIYRGVIRKEVLPFKGKTYTNGVDVIDFIGDVNSNVFYLPNMEDPGTRKPNPRCKQELEKILMEVKNGTAQIVYLDNVDWRTYLVSKETLIEVLAEETKIPFSKGLIIR